MKGFRGVRGGRVGSSVGEVDEVCRVLMLKAVFELHGGEKGAGGGVSSRVGSTRGVSLGWGIWRLRVGHGWMRPPVR